MTVPCARGDHRGFDHVGRRRRQRGEDAPGVEPAHTELAERVIPVEVSGPELTRRGVAAVGYADRAAYAEAALGEVQPVARRAA